METFKKINAFFHDKKKSFLLFFNKLIISDIKMEITTRIKLICFFKDFLNEKTKHIM